MTTTSGRSRRGDPATSREAGEKVELRASQARVLAMFNLYGDMHDKQLLDRLHDAERQAGFTKLMSPSGVRSRRSELSKPNMDRLAELLDEEKKYHPERDPKMQEHNARFHLKTEGFRSKLWDTGKREIVDGRNVVVWGLAR